MKNDSKAIVNDAEKIDKAVEIDLENLGDNIVGGYNKSNTFSPVFGNKEAQAS